MVDYSLVPFISMLVMNIAIFLRLRKRDKDYRRCTTVRNGHSTDVKNVTKHSNGMLILFSVLIYTYNITEVNKCFINTDVFYV